MLDDAFHVADTEAGVEQQRPVLTGNQERDDLLELPRLVYGEDAFRDPVYLEPVLVLVDALERRPFRAWQLVPPVVLTGATILHLLVRRWTAGGFLVDTVRIRGHGKEKGAGSQQ